jgi:hypothetical protein
MEVTEIKIKVSYEIAWDVVDSIVLNIHNMLVQEIIILMNSCFEGGIEHSG